MGIVVSRRAALAGLAGAVVASAARTAAAATTLRVGKAVAENFGFVPLDVGIEAGIFRKAGLDVEKVDFTGGAKLAQALTAGSIDISLSAGPELAFVAKGAPELAVASISSSPAFMGFNVGAQSTAKSLDDLRGQRIGVTSTGSLTDWLVADLNRVKGWTGADRAVALTVGGSNAADMAALKTDEVAATVNNTQFGYFLEQQHAGRLLAECTEYVKSIELFTIFASTALLQRNPDAVRAFLKGWFDAVAYMKRHKAETVAIGAKAMGFPADVTARTYDGLMSGFSTDGRFNRDALATLRQSFVEMKVLKGPVDLTKLYTEKFLPRSPAT